MEWTENCERNIKYSLMHNTTQSPGMPVSLTCLYHWQYKVTLESSSKGLDSGTFWFVFEYSMLVRLIAKVIPVLYIVAHCLSIHTIIRTKWCSVQKTSCGCLITCKRSMWHWKEHSIIWSVQCNSRPWFAKEISVISHQQCSALLSTPIHINYHP